MQTIQLPNEIIELIARIEAAGFEAYAAGGCVRETLRGKEPLIWQLVTNAGVDALAEIFPDAQITNAERGELRMDIQSKSGGALESGIPKSSGAPELEAKRLAVHMAPYRANGTYSRFKNPDGIRFTDSLAEDLARRDFTINAIAYHPERGLADLWNGAGDLVEATIRSVGDPRIRFQEDPLQILRAARFSAELGFEMHRETLAAMREKRERLKLVSAYRITEEFEQLIVGEYAGKGLRLLVSANLMPYIIGDLARSISGRGMKQFAVLADNIDKTKRIKERRLSLFYNCFGRQEALLAMERLKYDENTVEHITHALRYLDALHLIITKYELKRFLTVHGAEMYAFLDGVAKAQRLVYDLPEAKILMRHHMMQDIKGMEEPVFVEDLKINEDDLRKHGIAEGEKAEHILESLLHQTHRQPALNVRETLLAQAKRQARNPLLSASLKTRWMRWRNGMY